jgi:hypothetical protein
MGKKVWQRYSVQGTKVFIYLSAKIAIPMDSLKGIDVGGLPAGSFLSTTIFSQRVEITSLIEVNYKGMVGILYAPVN